jgi:hypothetical protein
MKTLLPEKQLGGLEIVRYMAALFLSGGSIVGAGLSTF